MKEKIITFVNQHILVIALISVLLVAAAAFSFEAYRSQQKLNKTVNSQTNAANKAVQESRNESGVAANYSIERRTEDSVREKVIAPKLDAARRRSANSQSELETAQKQYENAKTNIENFNRNVTDNCRELQRLFPDTKLEYCQP